MKSRREIEGRKKEVPLYAKSTFTRSNISYLQEIIEISYLTIIKINFKNY